MEIYSAGPMFRPERRGLNQVKCPHLVGATIFCFGDFSSLSVVVLTCSPSASAATPRPLQEPRVSTHVACPARQDYHSATLEPTPCRGKGVLIWL